MFLGTIGLVFVALADLIVAGFTSDDEVAPIPVRGLRISSAGCLFCAAGYVLTQSSTAPATR